MKPPRLSTEPEVISLEDSVFMAIYFRGKDKMYLGLRVECMNILLSFNNFVGALEE